MPCVCASTDEHGEPTTAAFLVKDDAERIYPTASKRLAPDFYFQPQVYRSDGQTIELPSGSFTLTVSRGPEYVPQTRRLVIAGPDEWLFRLVRWIDPVALWLVLRRSPHSFCRVLALPESDRRGDARGHVAADRRRSARCRLSADLGAVVLFPEAVLHRQRTTRFRNPASA